MRGRGPCMFMHEYQFLHSDTKCKYSIESYDRITKSMSGRICHFVLVDCVNLFSVCINAAIVIHLFYQTSLLAYVVASAVVILAYYFV